MAKPTKKEIAQAVKDGRITDEKSLATFIMNWETQKKIDEELPALKDILSKIKGDKGDKGDKGEEGKKGLDGVDGKDGIDGKNGKDGRDGKDGKDGETPNTTQIVATATQRAIQAIKPLIPTIESIENNLPMLGHEIRDSLELLTGNERLDKSAIKGLDDLFKTTQKIVGGGSIARNLYQLFDVGISSPTNGQILKYNSSTGRWENGTDSNSVTSVSNSDGTLTISPTTGDVIASLNLAHANTWTGQQTFSTSAPIFSTMTAGSVLFAGTSGLLSQDNSNFFWDDTNNRLGIGTASPDAAIHAVKTTEQLRLGYDGTYYTSFTVNSAGDLTIAPVGSYLNVSKTLKMGSGYGLLFYGGSYVSEVGDVQLVLNSANGVIRTGYGHTFQINYDGSNYTSFTVNSAGNLTITPTGGNVGIGTTTPGYKLEVNGTGWFSNKVAIGGSAALGSDSLDVYSSGTASTATFQNNGAGNGTAVIYVPVGNSVTGTVEGFRTTITSSVAADIAVYQSGAGSARFRALILSTGDGQSTYEINGGQAWSLGLDNSDSDKFKISGSTSLGTSDYLTIDTSGNVGIGTTSPSAFLHVIGTTEQLRIGYDASNYYKTTVGSTGGVTFDAVGSGAGFTFNDKVNVSNPVNLKNYTVATLPTGVMGDIAYVTDGDAGLAWGATAVNTGAGATKYLVWFNNANWTVVGK